MKNKKGFTLIELLAVIVILGVLLAIAVPAVTKYINSSRKRGFIANVKEYADSARSEVLDGQYAAPVAQNEATVISFSNLQPKLEKGGKTSSYDAEYSWDNCFVVIVNQGTAELPDPKYYVAALDKNGYGLGSTVSGSAAEAQIIQYDDLTNDNVVQLAAGVTYEVGAEDGSITTGTLSTSLSGYTGTITVTRVYK